jgi:vanillate O-demethylase monooxygenase subunit
MAPWLRNGWYAAIWAQDLQPGMLAQRTIVGEHMVLWRTEDGGVAALRDRCPHRNVPLHLGQVRREGQTARCAYHGLEFDKTGRCAHNPHGDGKAPAGMQVRAFIAVEKHTMIWVWPGEGEPDLSLIPDYSLLDDADPAATSKRDWLTMDVDYRLVIDNLLDLSHVSFLHEGILGNEQTAVAQIDVQEQGRGLTISRDMRNVPVPGLYDMLYRRDGGVVDHWTSMRWTAPSNLLNDSGVKEPGSPRAQGTGICGVHLLTPQTERSTMYHFAAVRQNPLPFPEAEAQDIVRRLAELRRFAFAEQDEPMIRAQQRILDESPAPPPPVLLPIDVGPVRYRRILDRLIAEE